MAFLVPDPYTQAIRGSGIGLYYTAQASYGGDTIVGADDLRPVGGSITDTTKPGTRRVLTLELGPTPGLYDLLPPQGVLLSVTAVVTYPSRQAVRIPMGVFDLDTESSTEGGGKLTFTAPDRWAAIQRAKFIGPVSSTSGMRVTDQIAALIRGAVGASEQVTVTATSTVRVGSLTWKDDREKAINDLAASIGAWVFCDRDGTFTIADLPTIGRNADWLVDASPAGVLVTLDRQRTRTRTYNVVAVTSTAAGGEAFPPFYLWDSDPNSATYAGPAGDGSTPPNPALAGPFGLSTYQHDDPNLTDAPSARAAAAAILARTVGRASSVNLTQVRNPAVDAFDVLDVLGPRQRYDIPRSLERHVVDTVTHPLDGSAQQIQGRSTRTDPYT